MTVEELLKKLADFDGEMIVRITDGEDDFLIDSVDDDGVDTVVIIAGDKVDG